MSMLRTESRAVAEAGSKNRAVQGVDQRLPIYTFLLRERDGYTTRATRLCAPSRFITTTGSMAACLGSIFQTIAGKDGIA